LPVYGGPMQVSNNIAIYLIKQGYIDPKQILKAELKSKRVNDIGVFYYGDSYKKEPSWIKKFFESSLGNIELFNASSRGILVIPVNVEINRQRLFALTFGYGWQYLKEGVYEERFGLKTVLNVVDPECLRKISKKNMSVSPKDTSEQLSKAGIISDFGIDVEQDLICSVTGKCLDSKTFGKTVTGAAAFHVSVKIDVHTINEFLKLCYEKYQSKSYQKNFSWVDQISEIKDPIIIDRLDGQLIDELKTTTHVTWMAVPEILVWENVSGFRYTVTKGDLYDDIHIQKFLSTLSESEREQLTISNLKEKSVYVVGTAQDDVIRSWSVYSCIYSEQKDPSTNKTFLLSSGKWYEISDNFAKDINLDFEHFREQGSEVSLPKCGKNEDEATYNSNTVAQCANYCLMDKQLITHGGGYSKVEFCDIFTHDNQMIHIKKYAGSSVLSHLFAQGAVAGELFLSDAKFREKVNEKLMDGFKLEDCSKRPNPSDYKIIFGVISESPNKLQIPFFSKVNLRHVRKRLETFGYHVSMVKIPKETV